MSDKQGDSSCIGDICNRIAKNPEYLCIAKRADDRRDLTLEQVLPTDICPAFRRQHNIYKVWKRKNSCASY